MLQARSTLFFLFFIFILFFIFLLTKGVKIEAARRRDGDRKETTRHSKGLYA
ncbi:hypothetical protein BDW66DRAFT_138053 [Aspergillus desertorum]